MRLIVLSGISLTCCSSPCVPGERTPEVLLKLASKGGEFAEALKKVPSTGGCTLTFGEVPETLGSKRLGLIQFLLAMLRSG
jgi:hypothetical protein